MNQTDRYIKRKCLVCNERTVNARQSYDPHISDYRDCEMWICEECKRKRYFAGKEMRNNASHTYRAANKR